MTNQTFTVSDLAQRWQLHEVTLRRLLETGEIPGFKVGHQWRITAAVVEAIETSTLPIQ